MVETCVGPSELHLKKELTALRRAHFLRDPETCSSWRSRFSSNSFIGTSKVSNINEIRENLTGLSNSSVSVEVPLRHDSNKNKKVYLCNWRYNSTKSCESGKQSQDEDQESSVMASQEDNLSNHHIMDSKSITHCEVPINMSHTIIGNSTKMPARRTLRKPRRKRGLVKNSSTSRIPDTASNSTGVLNSGGQSDDTENCSSENLRHLAHDLTLKPGCLSRCASPLFSGSRCGNWSHSSKILRISRKDTSSQSCTPASTSSYYKCGVRNPSILDSWDGTAESFDEDEFDQVDLPKSQGCSIPCYWSKRTKGRRSGAYYSPSLSDTLKRKGSSIICGGQTFSSSKKRSSVSYKQKCMPKSSQRFPLLMNNIDGGGSLLDTASDDLSTNFGELDLEALSRLDGRRWSSCKSQEGVEITGLGQADMETANQLSLSQKYQPMFFNEIVGQSIIVQSLNNAILRGRIAPSYLFQGPRGTGKTSIARIYAAALNCSSTKEKKPCWVCSECAAFSGRNFSNFKEVDATNSKSMDEVKHILKNFSLGARTSQYKVFVIDECHMLSSKNWSTLGKFLDEPHPRVVFIFITIDPDNLPRAIVSRCQKYMFSKIKDIDIVCRLRKLSAQEKIDVELDALDLIALNSEGSLRDAETMLDQLSLLGRKITTSLVNDLVGVVSDDKLLDLLEIAMSSSTAETIKRSREIMNSGVDPMALMSQLAALIMDIIAGTYRMTNSQSHSNVLGNRNLTEAEIERLQQALKILSDAEKQLRLSSERSTWFTAALLQLGSSHSSESLCSSDSSSKQSTRIINHGESNIKNDSLFSRSRRSFSRNFVHSGRSNDNAGKKKFRCLSPDELDEIWRQCIMRCHSKTLRQLLQSHGRLVSVIESNGITFERATLRWIIILGFRTLVALIVFQDDSIKSRAERFLSSITNSIEIVLGHNVEVTIGLEPEKCRNGLNSDLESPMNRQMQKYMQNKEEYNGDSGPSKRDQLKAAPSHPRRSLDSLEAMLQRFPGKSSSSAFQDYPGLSSDGKHGLYNSQGKGQAISSHVLQRAASDEQRLESAWLQTAEKYAPRFMNHIKPEKNQVMPQNGFNSQNGHHSSVALLIASNNQVDELNHEIRALKVSDSGQHKIKMGGIDHYAISPSLLHSKSIKAKASNDKDTLGYESGPNCNGLLCWTSQKTKRTKVKQGIHVGSKKTSNLSLFGLCMKQKEAERKRNECQASLPP